MAVRHINKPVRMLVYVTRKLSNVVFGFDQETVSDDSVTLLKTISVGGSGPDKMYTNQECNYFF